MSRGRARVIGPYLVFFLSGISGLVYQVLWVRQFGNVFGNTVHSASIVTAVFMGGLGVGSYLAGAWADRRHGAGTALGAPLFAAYGWSEIAIGALGVGLAVLLPRLAGLSAQISWYAPGPHGWNELAWGSAALRYGMALVLLAPITLLMGGTLTLLVRHLVSTDLDRAGSRIGALYGLNTAGAAAGALLTDVVFVPAVGVLRTQALAASINVAVGLAAIVIASRRAASEPARASPRPGAASSARRVVVLTALALCLVGFAGMGIEIMWFRFLAIALGSYRSVFSALLAVILTGMWGGATAGGLLARRFGHAATLLTMVQTLLVLTALGLLAAFDPATVSAAIHGNEAPSRLAEHAALFRPIVALVGVPAFLMGCSYPLANAHVQRAEESVGRRAGVLYLANTAGAVAGSLVAGFTLLPRVGSQDTLFWLATIGGAAVIPLYLSSRDGTGSQPFGASDASFAAAVLALVVGLASFRLLLAPDHVERRTVTRSPERTLAVSEGENEVVAVSVDARGYRRLWTNGHSMSATQPHAQRYMRAFVHVPLLQLEAPRRALVICFGVGNTVNAASLHPTLERIDVADLSRNVLERAPLFAATNGRVLEDPRVHVFVADGRQHLRTMAPGAYDLVTLEPPPLGQAGVAALYSREFYELVRSRLTADGFVTQWLPIYQLGPREVLGAVRAFVDVFPDGILLSGDQRELILMASRRGPVTLDVAAVERRVGERAAVRADLARVDLLRTSELAGTFAGSAELLRRVTRGIAAVTDDRPSMEYVHVSNAYDATTAPGELFDVSGVDTFCRGCADPEGVADLKAHLQVMAALYRAETFLRYPSDYVEVEIEALVDGEDGPVSGAIKRSRYLQRTVGIDWQGSPRALSASRLRALEGHARFRPASSLVELRLALADLAGDRQASAEAHLRRAVTGDPKSAAARFALGVALRGTPRMTEGVAQIREGLALAPDATEPRANLVESLLALGLVEEARAEAARLLGMDPAHGAVHRLLCLRMLPPLHPRDTEPHCVRAYEAGAALPAPIEARLGGRPARP